VYPFRWVALAGALVATLAFAPLATTAPAAVAKAASSDDWVAYSPEKLAQLTKEGKPVFVDFTAAWCVTCQVNKRLVLNNPAVREAFDQRGVELVRADWTRRDPVITQALAALGRQGVPVYVLYRPGKTPLVLPEILKKQIVFDALATLDTAQTVTLK
jgi:thiol:disulfide interchange protein